MEQSSQAFKKQSAMRALRLWNRIKSLSGSACAGLFFFPAIAPGQASSAASPWLAHYIRAGQLIDSGDCPSAIPELRTALANGPQRADEYYMLGVCLLEQTTFTPPDRIHVPGEAIISFKAYLAIERDGEYSADATAILNLVNGWTYATGMVFPPAAQDGSNGPRHDFSAPVSHVLSQRLANTTWLAETESQDTTGEWNTGSCQLSFSNDGPAGLAAELVVYFTSSDNSPAQRKIGSFRTTRSDIRFLFHPGAAPMLLRSPLWTGTWATVKETFHTVGDPRSFDQSSGQGPGSILSLDANHLLLRVVWDGAGSPFGTRVLFTRVTGKLPKEPYALAITRNGKHDHHFWDSLTSAMGQGAAAFAQGAEAGATANASQSQTEAAQQQAQAAEQQAAARNAAALQAAQAQAATAQRQAAQAQAQAQAAEAAAQRQAAENRAAQSQAAAPRSPQRPAMQVTVTGTRPGTPYRTVRVCSSAGDAGEMYDWDQDFQVSLWTNQPADIDVTLTLSDGSTINGHASSVFGGNTQMSLTVGIGCGVFPPPARGVTNIQWHASPR